MCVCVCEPMYVHVCVCVQVYVQMTMIHHKITYREDCTCQRPRAGPVIWPLTAVQHCWAARHWWGVALAGEAHSLPET